MDYRKLLLDIIQKINSQSVLKRIYELAEYLYLTGDGE